MKRYTISALHICFWLSIPFVIAFFKWAYQFTNFIPSDKYLIYNYFKILQDTLIISAVTVVIGASCFYVVSAKLVPLSLNFGSNARPITLYLLLLLIIPAGYILVFSLFSIAVSWFLKYFLLTGYLISIPFMALGLLVGSIKRSTFIKKEMETLEKHNIETELELLKSKINPHFLFNTINNIDVLIAKDPQMASQYLIQLCDLLRFMLYEANMAGIALKDEISYIKKYIDLQRIRSVNPNFVNLSVKGNIEKHKIPPMIFISLVENAFKFVTNKYKDRAIELCFDVSSSTIEFTCRNIFTKSLDAVSKGGLGINLVMQRLDLLYKDRYEMNTRISEDEMYYEVRLKIPLNVN